MQTTLIVLMVCLVGGWNSIPFSAQAEMDIQHIIDAQESAWNAKDIEGFMAYYWKSPDMTFQSGNRRLHGWEALLTRYKTTYAGEKMGNLKFKDISIQILTDNLAYVLGRYHLTYPDSTQEGLFTIILRKFPEGWHIIHDHSSS